MEQTHQIEKTNNLKAMRINISTGGKPIYDRDIKALYILGYALQLSTDRMVNANLKFAIENYYAKKEKERKKKFEKLMKKHQPLNPKQQ